MAEAAPTWLQSRVPPEWYQRYGLRFDNTRLPDADAARTELALIIGLDGCHLLEWLQSTPQLKAFQNALPVETLRLVWIQQYCWIDGSLFWRTRHEHGMAPAATTILTPYDVEARFGQKRGQKWVGYKVHLTESCDDDLPHVITHVATTEAGVPDNHLGDPIHAALAAKALLPQQHLVDAGYPDGENLVTSRDEHKVDLFGPVRPNNSWQAREESAYDSSQFIIDWQARTATCPEGVVSLRTKPDIDISGRDTVRFIFSEHACGPCLAKERCTKGKARQINVLLQTQHEILQAARLRQQSDSFKEAYKKRAGIEGTISQAVQALTMRRSRYRGLAKTHLQHMATAAAMNLIRVIHWLNDRPRATTRQSRFARLAPA